MIESHERLAAVLARDPRLLEMLADAWDALKMLRVATTREVMEKLVTVEEAAQMAGMPADALIAKLEAVLAGSVPEPALARRELAQAVSERLPDALAQIAAARLTDVDVRDDLRRGVEPFHRIMTAVASLNADQVLRLRATFDPSPLKVVLQKRGYAAFTERLAADDFRVWFYRGEAASDADAAPSAAPAEPPFEEPENVQTLDVRGLEPPEPMVRTLTELARLPEGGALVQLNVRVPELLLPKLTQRGFSYQIHEVAPGLVKVLIYRTAKE